MIHVIINDHFFFIGMIPVEPAGILFDINVAFEWCCQKQSIEPRIVETFSNILIDSDEDERFVFRHRF